MAGVSPDVLRPLFEDALEMLSLAWRSFQRHDPAGLDRAERLGRTIHKREKELTEGLLASPPDSGTPPFVPGHFERIGNAAEGLVRCLRGMEDESATFTEGGTREVNELFERAIELTQCAGDLVLTGNRVLARHIEIESMRFARVERVPGHARRPARDRPSRAPDREPRDASLRADPPLHRVAPRRRAARRSVRAPAGNRRPLPRVLFDRTHLARRAVCQ